MTAPTIINGEVREGHARAAELHEQIGAQMFERAYGEGMNLSAFLEQADPSEGYNDGLDAFGRQMQIANIRVRPAAGRAADRLEAFDKNGRTRALLTEWMARQWRRVSAPELATQQRAIYQISDQAPGTLMRPYVDSAITRGRQLQPAIPISALVATTTQIDGDTYRAMYITDNPAQQRFVRVGENAPIPTAKLSQGERETKLYKFGRGIEITYEALRRQRIDRVALHIARMAVQAEVDKVSAIIDVLINGDGNADTSATNVRAKADLDSAATGKAITLKAWLLFKMKFKNPYMLTTVLAKDTDAYKLLSLNIGTSNVPLVSIAAASGFGSFTQINPGLADGVGLGWTDDAPTDKLLAFDARMAIERVTEVASNLTEVARWVERQATTLYMSEVEGYASMEPAGVYTLELES